jgi:hypothetical protein
MDTDVMNTNAAEQQQQQQQQQQARTKHRQLLMMSVLLQLHGAAAPCEPQSPAHCAVQRTIVVLDPALVTSNLNTCAACVVVVRVVVSHSSHVPPAKHEQVIKPWSASNSLSQWSTSSLVKHGLAIYGEHDIWLWP